MKKTQFFIYIFALITLSQSVSQSDVVSCVKKQVGKPYISGGIGPKGFDCSGLAYYCHKKAIPRSPLEQSKSGTYVAKSDLKPGDLMFWNTSGNKVSHTSIFMGNGQMIHAPLPGKNVKLVSYNTNYWKNRYVTGRRYWK